MNKICTNVKQSRNLTELGIDINTADMHYMYRYWEIDEETIGSQSDASIGFDLDFYYGTDNGKTYHYIPCWSLAALLNILPNEIITDNRFECHYQIDIRKYDGGDNTTLHQIAYGNNRGLSGSWRDMVNTGEKENLIDCCVQIILELHKLKML